MKKHQFQFALLALTSAAILSSCSHSEARKEVDQELATGKPVASLHQLSTDVRANVQNAPNLTPEQKTKLLDLQARTHTTLEQNRQDILKLNELLVQELTSAQYSQKKVDEVKSRLKKTSDARLDVTFHAFDEANKILGRDTSRNQNSRMMHDLFIDHLSGE